jgi:hypothetical protein
MAQAEKIEINPTEAPTEVATLPARPILPQSPSCSATARTRRGAWFPADDIEAVLAGAAEMGMHTVKASTPEIISLAQRLPKGRIFDSGKLFTPLIQTKVYDESHDSSPRTWDHGQAEAGDECSFKRRHGDADAEGPGASVPEGTRPTDWSQITVGSLVLAEEARWRAGSKPSCWRPDREDVFKLKYRDYPDDPIITRTFAACADDAA